MNNQEKTKPLPATTSGPKPGDFPVRSPQSRAAARALVEAQRSQEPWYHMIEGDDSNGEQVWIYFGKDERVARIEVLRGEGWVRVRDCPRLSKIKNYTIRSGNVLLLGGDCPKARDLLASIPSQ